MRIEESMTTFTRATKKQAKLRMAIDGPSGSGKTYTSLKLAERLGHRIALIDTERGSASKYADEFEFDVLELESFSPRQYVEGINAAAQAGYEVLIIDSLSHAWTGKGGVLEEHDKAVARQKTANSFTAWRDVTPMHNALIDAILQAPMHVIATMRSKTEYIQTTDNGKTVVKKVGLAPVQRDGVEYEFDIVADMDNDNTLVVTKSRCKKLSGAVIAKPDGALGDTIKQWLSDGATPMQPTATKAASTRPSPVIEGPTQQPTLGADIVAAATEQRTEEQRVEIVQLVSALHWTEAGQFNRWAASMGWPLPLSKQNAAMAIIELRKLVASA